MTRTQYYVAASLDGYIADRNGKLDWLFSFDDAEGVADRYQAFMAGVGALAMGASTYEFILDMGHPWPYARTPTWVFTHRDLPRVEGADIRFTSADVADVHREMVAAAAHRNVWLVGGGNLVAQFVRRGLLDEILLSAAPVVLGGGTPLLPEAIPGQLALRGVTQLGKGLVELHYDLPRSR